MAFDSIRSRAVLFGGPTLPAIPLGDTWEWDGEQWLQVATTGPQPRTGHAMAFDPGRGRTVLYGGANAQGNRLLELHEWDGQRWAARTPSGSPSPRSGHALAHDGRQRVTLLFGGTTATGVLDETWTWDGTAWVRRTPAMSPPARWGHGLVWDARRERIVLFGGTDGADLALDDTWEWDGVRWQLCTSSTTRPTARTHHAMAYDAARERVVVFGGKQTQPFTWLSDTWEWDGTGWRQRMTPESPRPRSDHAMVFDAGRGQCVVTGGVSSFFAQFADTWLYGAERMASYSRFGQGCVGSAGLPVLAASGGHRPWLGEAFGVTLGSLPQATVAVLWVGGSRSSWGSLRLPLALWSAGMPGCDLLVSPDEWLSMVITGGSATRIFYLPADPALLGAEFHNQALVVDPPANPLGATVTNGGLGTIGAR
jgi:hypothetical protein